MGEVLQGSRFNADIRRHPLLALFELAAQLVRDGPELSFEGKGRARCFALGLGSWLGAIGGSWDSAITVSDVMLPLGQWAMAQTVNG